MISPVTPLQIAGAGITLSARGGRSTVPVSPASYIYSHFKHISGVPAPEGVQGVAVSKLKILDTIIEHLSQARAKNSVSFELADGTMSDKQLDVMIEFLKNEIESAAAANAAMPYTPNPQLATGTFFNITA
ncbi:MAG: hypothetical protein LBV68_06105 [Spirochaetaceae bacterium]|jgi:hypothetical protein|nr:hypothetical protein [Spirochaetaceae bacterium]